MIADLNRMQELAIVIPAYKIQYLDKALTSIARQTNKSFTVYVGDDCSPDNIKSICDKYVEDIDLKYHRFADNLGSKDLVKQWERCVSLAKGEKWLWLFSDDDIADEQCVEFFFQALVNTKEHFDVYRFNTVVINEDDSLKGEAEPSPEIENPMSLAYNILLWKRGNSMPDHIFRYAAYIELNGFVNFPFAQASDWATSINFSYPKGLYTIAGPKVKWRLSGQNVSSVASANRNEMILGHLQFIEWVNKKFTKQDENKYQFSLLQIERASINNLRAVMVNHYKGIPYSTFISVVRRIRKIYNYNLYQALLLGLKINYLVVRPRLGSAVKRLLSIKFS